MTQISLSTSSQWCIMGYLLALTPTIAILWSLGDTASAFDIGNAAQYLLKPWCMAECCNEYIWINRTNSTGLQHALNSHLYGQHLVSSHVVGAIKGHLSDNDPRKPLVLSFHGRTGTGKNFVARLIAESIYSKGMNSQFVHLFSANEHFPHKKYVDDYKDHLKNIIRYQVNSCPYQLFIFDEIEDMPEGLLDSIKPYLDYNIHMGGVDYRKAIFILLSNTAALEISRKTQEHLVRGGNREDIKLHEMEKIIEKTAYNAEGGFSHSRLIDSYVVSHFVPFLPLEKRHVRDCIRAALQHRHHIRRTRMDRVVDDVLAHLQFVPEKDELFALKGCKNVDEKVTLILHQMRREL